VLVTRTITWPDGRTKVDKFYSTWPALDKQIAVGTATTTATTSTTEPPTTSSSTDTTEGPPRRRPHPRHGSLGIPERNWSPSGETFEASVIWYLVPSSTSGV